MLRGYWQHREGVRQTLLGEGKVQPFYDAFCENASGLLYLTIWMLFTIRLY
jgi:hypothetical protein